MEERCSRIKVSWVNSLHDCINNAVSYLKLKCGQLSRVFFTADTHFGNVRTLELSKRPFFNTDEMDFLIISNWNKVITDNDIVYHLGDFGNTDLIKFLKGKLIFILPGNYDTQPVLDQLKKDNRVYILPTVSSFTYQDTETLGLVHEPTLATNKKLFWLFGHIHGLQTVKLNGLNVGVDCHHFKPLDLDTVLFYKNGIQNHYDDNVFISTLELKQ
jgi:calcineurin-like phosphoesterase family protein